MRDALLQAAPTEMEVERFCNAAYHGRAEELLSFINRYGMAIAGMENDGGYNGFTLAACGGQVEVMQLLLTEGFDINTRDSRSYTALTAATHWSNNTDEKCCKAIAFLVDHGADINARNKWEKTALMQAVEHNSHATAEMLLEKGADIFMATDTGLTAMSLAKDSRMQSLIERHIQKREDKKEMAATMAQAQAQLDALKKARKPKVRLARRGA